MNKEIMKKALESGGTEMIRVSKGEMIVFTVYLVAWVTLGVIDGVLTLMKHS